MALGIGLHVDLLELVERPIKAHLGRTQRDAEDVRHFLESESTDVFHHDDLALILAQRAHRFLHGFGKGLVRTGRQFLLSHFTSLVFASRRVFRSLSIHLFSAPKTEIVDDSEKPGLEGRAVLELMQFVVNLHKRILAHLLGVLEGSDHLVAGVEDKGFMASQEFLESSHIHRRRALAAIDQLPVSPIVQRLFRILKGLFQRS